MDGTRFDSLARHAAQPVGRRAVVCSIAGAVLAATRPPRAALADNAGHHDKGDHKGKKDDNKKDKKDNNKEKRPCQKDYNLCATSALAACGAAFLPHDQVAFHTCLEDLAECCDLVGQCDIYEGNICLFSYNPEHPV